MTESSAERKLRNETLRTALAEFRLLRPRAEEKTVEADRGEGFAEAKDFADILSSSLGALAAEFDAVQDNAMRMEKRTAGYGRLDDDPDEEEEDEETLQVTMMTVRNSKSAFTKQGRSILASAEKCAQILSSGRISVRDASILSHNMRFLLEIPVFEALGLRGSPDGDPDGKAAEARLSELKGRIAAWLDGLWAGISDEPYVRLGAMLGEVYGLGALKELEGVVPADRDRFISKDIGTPEDLYAFANSLGSLKEQGKTGWDSRFPAVVREISEMISKEVPETQGYEDERRLLSSYAGLPSVAGTASECLAAVRRAEKDACSKRSIEVDGADLPLSGLGHVLDARRYRRSESGSSPMDHVTGSLSVAHSLYSGRQGLQNKILTAARILCGQDPQEKEGSLGGTSWFGPASRSYLSAVPLNLRGAAGSDLTELCATWFTIDSALSRLEALPAALLPQDDPLVREIEQERGSCGKLLDMLSSALRRALETAPDLKFDTSGVDIRNFHLLETSAVPDSGGFGIGESRLPYEIAKDTMRDFVKGLLHDTYREGPESAEQMKAALQKCFSMDDTDSWKEFVTRLCETVGFRPSYYPVVTGPEGKPVTLPASDRDDRKCREMACKWIIDQITGITDRKSPVLASMLEAFSAFGAWNRMYGEAVEGQKKMRLGFEKARAAQWLDILKSGYFAITEPSPELDGLTYTQAATVAARETNAMISGLLTDTVMRRASRIMDDGTFRAGRGQLTDADVGRICGHFLDLCEGRQVERDPLEDYACAAFMRPVISHALSQTRKNIERNLNKQIDEEDRTVTETVRRPTDLNFLQIGGVIDFGSDIVMSDAGLAAIADAAFLHRSALGMSALSESEKADREAVLRYAEEQMDNLVLEKLYGSVTPEEMAIAGAPMDASVQKRLVEDALSLWERSRDAMDGGDMPEAAALLSDAEKAISDAKGNNPLFDPENRLVPMMEEYDARIPDILREERWASPDAQFSERMSDEDDRVPETVLLEASRTWMGRVKSECADAEKKASGLSELGIEDPEKAVAVARTVMSAVSDVFSPEAGILMERGIADGAGAMSFIHTVKAARRNLEEGLFREMSDGLLKDVAAMGCRLNGGHDGTKWNPEPEHAGIGYVSLVTKTENGPSYSAGEPSSQTAEENRLYEVTPRKGGDRGDGWKAVSEKLKSMLLPDVSDYGREMEKKIFSRRPAAGKSKLDKWNSAQNEGARSFVRRTRMAGVQEMLVGY